MSQKHRLPSQDEDESYTRTPKRVARRGSNHAKGNDQESKNFVLRVEQAPTANSNIHQQPGVIETPTSTSGFLCSDPLQVCFGTIADVKVQLRLPLLQDPLGDVPPFWRFPIVQQNGFSVLVSPDGRSFGTLNKKTCKEIQALLENGLPLEFVAYMAHSEWVKGRDATWYPETPPVITTDVNIYGLYEHASAVGSTLTPLRTFLQEPLYGLELKGFKFRYHNPQFLHLEQLSDQKPTGFIETPITHLEYCDRSARNQGNATKPHTTESEVRFKDKAEIQNIWNSLGHEKILHRRHADKRIKTPLLRHQAEAFDFVIRRETDNLQGDLSLWQRVEDEIGGTLTFRHIITGVERDTAADTRGGIVADDMGLGKTLVMLATVAHSSERARKFVAGGEYDQNCAKKLRSRATLVITPSSLLMDSWVDEIRKHTAPGELAFYKHHGHGRLEQMYQKQLFEKEIILTTYATVASEVKRGKGILGQIHWYRIILDEAREVRNRSTKQHQAISSLLAEHRWCLTGTPIENTVDDLGALVTFLRVPLLENSTTFRKFVTPPKPPGLGFGSADHFKNLRLLLNSICIRRTREVLKLKDPETLTTVLELTPTEREEYNMLHAQHQNEVDRVISGYGKTDLKSTALRAILELRLFCNNGRSSTESQTPDEILSGLIQQDEAECTYRDCSRSILTIKESDGTEGALLIKNCLHLVCQECIPRYNADNDICPQCKIGNGSNILTMDQPRNIDQVQERVGFQFPRKNAEYPTKIKRFLDDISERPSQKSIAFSFWRKTLDLMGQGLHERNIPFAFVHGSISNSERRQILETFCSPTGPNLLLITLGTGAVGLNLAVASRVYIMEPQWNPSLEEQAIARCHRFGQKESVTIVKYITKNTIEHSKVLRCQRSKISMAGRGFENEHLERQRAISDMFQAYGRSTLDDETGSREREDRGKDIQGDSDDEMGDYWD